MEIKGFKVTGSFYKSLEESSILTSIIANYSTWLRGCFTNIHGIAKLVTLDLLSSGLNDFFFIKFFFNCNFTNFIDMYYFLY